MLPDTEAKLVLQQVSFPKLQSKLKGTKLCPQKLTASQNKAPNKEMRKSSTDNVMFTDLQKRQEIMTHDKEISMNRTRPSLTE